MDRIRCVIKNTIWISINTIEKILNLKLVPHGNVASDNAQCSQYGIDMLKIGGNAVDAAITTALCNSVALLHLSGLGG